MTVSQQPPRLRLRREHLPFLVAGVVLIALALAFPAIGGPGLLALAVAFGLWSRWRDQQRSGRLREFAAEHGWTFKDRDDGVLARWSSPALTVGRNRRAENVVTGWTGGHSVLACDYHATVDAMGRPTPLRYAVVATTLGYAPLPQLGVSPAPQADPHVGPQQFEQAFTVSYADPRFAAAVLTPAVKQLLLDQGRDVSWQVDRTDLVAWRNGRHDPAKLEAQALFLARLADVVSAAAAGSH